MTSPAIGAYNQALTSVGSTATLIAVTSACGTSGVVVQNVGSNTVYIGGASVTSSGATQGISVAANGIYTFPTTGGPANQLYAITASSTSNVVVLFSSGA